MSKPNGCVACCSPKIYPTGETQPVDVCGEWEDRPEYECAECGCTWAE